MALIEINKDPSKTELKWFGLLFLLFFGIVGGVAYGILGTSTIPGIIGGAAAVVTALYYLIPAFRMPLYLGWMYASYPIGWVISHTILAITFYLVVTPIGLLVRLFVGDPMRRKFDRTAESYWITREVAPPPSRYFRQF
jgi:hypothetical protein